MNWPDAIVLQHILIYNGSMFLFEVQLGHFLNQKNSSKVLNSSSELFTCNTIELFFHFILLSRSWSYSVYITDARDSASRKQRRSWFLQQEFWFWRLRRTSKYVFINLISTCEVFISLFNFKVNFFLNFGRRTVRMLTYSLLIGLKTS